jgi:hypothetical protein
MEKKLPNPIPLAYYIRTNQNESVKGVITRKNINSYYTKFHPLYYASLYGNREIFSYFLDIGGDLYNCCPTLVSDNCDIYYSVAIDSVLHVASLNIIKNLLDVNVISIDHRYDYDNMNTILLIAASSGRINTVKYLVEKCNANISYENVMGLSALDLAAINGYHNIVVYLIKKGLTCKLRVLNHIKQCSNILSSCETIESSCSFHINVPIKFHRYKSKKFRALWKTYDLLYFHNTFRRDYLDHKYRTLKKIGYLSIIPGDITRLIVNYI